MRVRVPVWLCVCWVALAPQPARAEPDPDTRSGKVELLRDSATLGVAPKADGATELTYDLSTTHWMSGPLELGGTSYCALAFQEHVRGADSFRTRYAPLPPDEPWLLISFSTGLCAKPQEPRVADLLDDANGSDAIAWRGATGTAGYERQLGLVATHTALRAALATELQSSQGNLFAGDGAAVWERITKIVAAAPAELLPRRQQPLAAESLPPIWTTKVPSDRAVRILITPKPAAGACAPQLTRNLVAYGLRGRPVLLAEQDAKAAEEVEDLNAEVASRTVRIELLNKYDVVDYCTGYLLTSKLVLTAAHCAFLVSEQGETLLDCLTSMADCESYSVDVNYQGRAGPFISLPVRRAFGPMREMTDQGMKPTRDYAFLELVAEVPNVVPLARKAVLALRNQSQLEANGLPNPTLWVLAHPHGNRASVDNDCGALYGGKLHVLHSCYTQGGSSGSLLWLKRDVTPVAVHNKYARQCGSDEILAPQKTAVYAEVPKDLKASDINSLLWVLKANTCVGVALMLPEVQRDYCGREADRDPAVCEALKGLVMQWENEVAAP